MPVTLDGAPTHVLIVHAIVVLLPLAVVGSLVLVAVPATRRAFSWLTLVVAFLACLAIPFAFVSGSALERRVAPNPLIHRHVTLAHELLPLAAVFGVVLAAFVVVDFLVRCRSGSLNVAETKVVVARPGVVHYAKTHRLTFLHRAVAVLLVVLAVGTGFQVYRVGAAGAKAAWSGRISAPVQGR